MSGYVRLHRSLIGHPAFRNDAEAMAFAWLIARAAWKPVRVRYKGKGYALERGQLAISIRDMAEALDRNKNWISRVLQRMRDEDMIATTSGTAAMVVTIRNYDEHQCDKEERGTAKGTAVGTDAGQTRDTEQEREEVKKKESGAPRGTRLPEGFVFPEEWLVWAENKKRWSRADAVEESELFCLHWQTKAGQDARKTNWFLTWQKWITGPFCKRACGSAAVAALPPPVAAANYEDHARFFDRIGRHDDAEEYRRKAAKLRGATGPPGQPISEVMARIVGQQARVG